ncbi:MAG: helix-turn-helix transcriptional regulator [Oscillospiraceae bacterium]|nr:helix-turn-helix transcriptional regulator [Oscillospiraceae bacterium]
MLRYKINILEELKKAGYSTYRMRQEKVLSESTLQRIREGSTVITMESLGVICDILQCQPGNLVEWVPSGNAEE